MLSLIRSLKHPTVSPLLRSAGYGAIAGMRSMTAPAWAAYTRSMPGERALRIAAIAEMAADKVPFIPARITAAPFVGRVLIGALAAGLAEPRDRSVRTPVECMIVGGVAAGLSTVASYHLRQWVDRHSKLPDAAVAVAEDSITLALGSFLRYRAAQAAVQLRSV